METDPLNNQTAQPQTSSDTGGAPKKKSPFRFILGGLVILVIGVAGYFAVKQQGAELFKAELTGGSAATNSASSVYIPNTYRAQANDPEVTIEVIAGDTFTADIKNVIASFTYNSTDINFWPIDGSDSRVFLDLTNTDFSSALFPIAIDNGSGLISVNFTMGGAAVNIASGEVLFKLKAKINDVASGTTIPIAFASIILQDASDTTIDLGADPSSDGLITIDEPPCVASDWECTFYTAFDCPNGFELRSCSLKTASVGICDATNDQGKPDESQLCTCAAADWEYSAFSVCIDGNQTREACFPGDANTSCSPDAVTCEFRLGITPDSLPTTQECGLLTGDVSALILSLDEATVNTLTPAQRSEAFAAAVILINSPNANGTNLDIEGSPFTLAFDDPNDIDDVKLRDIAQNLADDINAAGIGLIATPNTSMPSGTTDLSGFVLINTTAANNDDDVDIDQTFQAGNVSILPFSVNGLTLLQTDNLGMQVVARFADNTTKLLVAREIVWVNDINNRLSDIDLDAGRLKAGDASGFSTIYVTVIKEVPGATPDDPPVQVTVFSNTITVNVPSGPVIEYARIIGADAIVRGGRVDLSVKVSDFDTIADIQDITTSITTTDESTFFTMVPFTITDIAVMNTTSEEGEETAEGTTTSQNYRIYDIPVEIPTDSNLTDGPYNLLLEITDTSGHTASRQIPITIGAIATGDLNNDGNINMIDVIIIYQLVNSGATLTAADVQSGDLNQDGSVNMIDVITLYNLVNQ